MPSLYVNEYGAAPVNTTSRSAEPPLQSNLSPEILAVTFVTDMAAEPMILAPVPVQPAAVTEVIE